MNTLKNSVKLIGRLGADPKVTQFSNNNTVARFSLATNESYKKDGEWINNTTWHNIVAWGKAAELCAQLLKKGSEVHLQGRLVYNNYETKEGDKRYTTEISLNEFILINRDKKEEIVAQN